jgi:hypothetical protein
MATTKSAEQRTPHTARQKKRTPRANTPQRKAKGQLPATPKREHRKSRQQKRAPMAQETTHALETSPPDAPQPEESQLDGLQMLPLSPELVSLDQEIQPRAGLSPQRIKEYAELYRDGHDLGRILIFRNGSDYWLVDGFHRWEAARQAQLEELPAEVRPGTKRDAMLAAAGANKHGIPRSVLDKRLVVTRLLNDPEWVQWSDRTIARHCGVSNTFVGSVRQALLEGLTVNVDSETRTYRSKHGMAATKKTGNIGKRRRVRPEALAEAIQAEMAAGKTAREAVDSGCVQHGVPSLLIDRPAPEMAFAIAQATGGQVSVLANDQKRYDGTVTPEEVRAERQARQEAQAAQWRKEREQRQLVSALENLATLEHLAELLEDLPEQFGTRLTQHLPRALEQLTTLASLWAASEGQPLQAYTAHENGSGEANAPVPEEPGHMPMTCLCCRHPEKSAIEAAMATDIPLRTIADRFQVSKTALIRHRQHGNGSQAPRPDRERLAAEAQHLHERAIAGRGPQELALLVRAVTALLVKMTARAAPPEPRPGASENV